jgi:hypothetical protein
MGHLKDSGGDILRREQERVKEIGLLSTGARSKPIVPMVTRSLNCSFESYLS